MTFREILHKLRKEKGWSVKTLAEKSGLPVGTLNGYLLAGPTRSLPVFRNAVLLARALGVSIVEFENCSDWVSLDSSGASDQLD